MMPPVRVTIDDVPLTHALPRYGFLELEDDCMYYVITGGGKGGGRA
jgi:hypothetical protein